MGIFQPATRTWGITSFGLHIAIEVFDAACLPDVLERLPPGWRRAQSNAWDRSYRILDAGPSARDRYQLIVNDDLAERMALLDHLLDALEGDIQIYVAEFATPHLFVHAGVVAWEGRALVLPGSSFAGKSTLVTSLVAAGATYYSDEYAVLDAEGDVLPYLRRVSLREGPHGPAGRLDLGTRAQTDAAPPLPVGLVALLRYRPDAGWCVRPLSHGRAVMALCQHTVPIQRRPAETLAILGKVADSARVVEGTRGEVDDAVTHILQLLSSGAQGA